MSTYNDASLIYYPSGYKESKAYSLKPTDGSGDLTFTRASTATRVNSSGLIESVATGVPRIDYTGGGCAKLLLEPQRTNLVFPSATGLTQTVTTTAQSYTLSFYGTGTVVRSGTSTGTLVGTGANDRVFVTFTATAGSLTLTVTGSVTNWQLELGSFATSYIPTTTTAVTRVVDSASKTGMGYNLLNGYTVFFNFETLSVTAYNQFQFRQNASNYILRIGNNYNIGNALAQGPNILGKNKYALSVQNNGNYALYRNSILLANGTGVTANLEEIRSDLPGPHLIDSIILYEIALSNAELETLTTL